MLGATPPGLRACGDGRARTVLLCGANVPTRCTSESAILSSRIVDICLWTLRELSTLAKNSITIARVLTLELRVHRRANP